MFGTAPTAPAAPAEALITDGSEITFLQDVIEPSQTRRLVARSFDLLRSKQEMLAGKKHGNSPL